MTKLSIRFDDLLWTTTGYDQSEYLVVIYRRSDDETMFYKEDARACSGSKSGNADLASVFFPSSFFISSSSRKSVLML